MTKKDEINPISPKSIDGKWVDCLFNDAAAHDNSESKTGVKLFKYEKRDEKTQDIGKVNQNENLTLSINIRNNSND